ncbi:MULTISPECIES: SDR family oxidoreductase [Halomicrobium]|uniref:Short-chain dehydrogenase/reductase SDR n=2 Tax=Halomicrobium mukohataei TaxID=57705 RepID=C7NZM0_HALMD|nr:MULTISPECIES: SDR family oxidoreductase [Halomicrobium]ACV48788.1 short-chain dehydrogenase/reductase SDR [Halomicrobium mukohataei DSM 12286]QCD64219.1 SDR family oxidoreductase [Halomicrobium mukohataei]QFR19025.1 SDR family oxidoreductase [Halomicrobium sp. ZPS1]
MSVEFDFDGSVVLVTGVGGALGGAVARAFDDAGATVCGADIVAPESEDFLLDETEAIDYYQGDFTDEDDVADIVAGVVEEHGRLDALCNIAGTWRGGDPIHETDADTFDFLFDVNLKTMFLASKHALPHLRESEGAVVSVSARSSLEGGEGDGIYRATKAGVRLLTETIAAENEGVVRANAVMPSVIDTPMNREMMPDADFETWVDPDDIATMMLFLCSEGAPVTSGAAVPVYGEA